MGMAGIVLAGSNADTEVSGVVEVVVQERAGYTTEFSLRMALDFEDGTIPLLEDDQLGPGSLAKVRVDDDGRTETLVCGPITGHQAHLVAGGADSWLEVRGGDRCVELDREVKVRAFADVSDSDAVSSILGELGFTPDVETTATQHLEAKHSLIQRETDLQFLRRLARRNGMLFWLTDDELGTTGHFRLAPTTSAGPQLVLAGSRGGSAGNLTSFDLAWDGEQPTRARSFQLDLNSLADIDGSAEAPSQSALGELRLSALASAPRDADLVAASDEAADLAARSQGMLNEADWFIRAQCTTTQSALGGRVVRAHGVVQLDGAGARHSGDYFVAAVRHHITDAEHRMTLELLRNGFSR